MIAPARSGWRCVEELREGEWVLARSEHDPAGVPERKAVEARFERTACVLHLHVGGQVVRTTWEHPFYVDGRGWTPAGRLRPGDRVASLSGEWVAVEEVYDTGLYEPVYNLRVADHHTYFVGDDGWGFALWAHNAYDIQFLSGLKVVEQVKSQPGATGRLTQGEEDAILRAIRNHGTYGAMGQLDGNRAVVVELVRYELWFDSVTPAGYTADLEGVLKGHFNLACVKEAHAKEQKRITGGPAGGWVAYIDGLGGDALGRTKAQFEAAYHAAGGDPTKPRTHGHHIVYKDGADQRNPAALAQSQVAAREARDVLLYYGINPYWDRENLAFTPKFPHPVAAVEHVRDQLKAAFLRNESRAVIVVILQDMARGFIEQTLPGMKNYGGTP